MENKRYKYHLEVWCPCGCGRKVSKEKAMQMIEDNESHTTNISQIPPKEV